jgi:hypothetical protein
VVEFSVEQNRFQLAFLTGGEAGVWNGPARLIPPSKNLATPEHSCDEKDIKGIVSRDLMRIKRPADGFIGW